MTTYSERELCIANEEGVIEDGLHCIMEAQDKSRTATCTTKTESGSKKTPKTKTIRIKIRKSATMKNSRGGKREGAGRKPAPVGTTKQVYNTKLTPEVVQFLRQCDNAAQAIDDTIKQSQAFRNWIASRK